MHLPRHVAVTLTAPAICLAAGRADASPVSDLGATLPLWSALPFAGLLLSIALLPLLAPRFWHHRYPWVAIGWGALLAVPFLVLHRDAALELLLHALLAEYIPFVILLGALFTICGGIVVRGTLTGSPGANTLLLAIGTALASWIGTTGASMLLIRPLLRANSGRIRRTHSIVFFIFLVSNIGGLLTPLGDPPLFLGFLSGVPFFWTLRLAPHLLLTSGLLLGLFYLLDRHRERMERPVARILAPGMPTPAAPIAIAGWSNVALLAGVLAAVLLSGVLRLGSVSVLGVPLALESLLRDAALLVLAGISLGRETRVLREENEFTWEPLREVAILFAAIFVTIVPAIAILSAGEHGALGAVVRSAVSPWQYFWVTGGLSAVLDNAPTYLTFLATALGRHFPGVPLPTAVPQLAAEHPHILEAISAGAVFMGAVTYIGNAPNFMVRSIAARAGIPMPSFLAYAGLWSLPILVPIFLLVTLVFFR